MLPTQAIFPGLLESAYRRELQDLSDNDSLARLWARDTSLWPAEEFQSKTLKSNLGWLDLPEQHSDLVARTKAMGDACGTSALSEANPAVSLAAFLAAAELHGMDRLVFFGADSSKPFAGRIGYLVGASTGKEGRDPDLRESRTRTVQILEQMTAKRQPPAPTVRVREGEVDLYAEGETRQQISTLNMAEALRTFFGLRHRDGYIALLPFVNSGESAKVVFRRIRERLESLLALPVLVTPGPRYIHAIGQVYMGGPPKGIFLLVTAAPSKDLAIPGADYSFGQLQLALALGEFESLGSRRRPVIRLHLAGGTASGLAQLEAILNNALGKNRIASS